ncbi:MAG: hypothetical protein KAT34_14415 [Candidatus Aminicenantes bacterium]|nr:hypothetical protein [Candidatus Aminicenantes bacterium]
MKKTLMIMMLIMVMLFPLASIGSEQPEQTAKDDKVLIRENKQKQKSTMGDLVGIGKAIAGYMGEPKIAPKASSIKELQKILVPRYIKEMPVTDGWGNELFYQVNAEDPGKYWLASGGSNGKLEWDGKSENFFPVMSLKDFAKDIVFSNGRFLCGPKVK